VGVGSVFRKAFLVVGETPSVKSIHATGKRIRELSKTAQ
jgi:hypothetical protein